MVFKPIINWTFFKPLPTAMYSTFDNIYNIVNMQYNEYRQEKCIGREKKPIYDK